jgi:ribosomal protein S18 acetylase RimI-like enzyme
MIRRLYKDDREKIKKIIIDTKHFNDDEVSVAMELIDFYLSDKDQMDYIIQVYVTDDTKIVAGYICYGRRPLTDMTYDLYWIAVDPEIHGKGIGKELVRFMETDVKQMGGYLILIETSGKAHYEGERRFYEKCGYEVQTVIKDFYRAGDDLFVFRKYLRDL